MSRKTKSKGNSSKGNHDWEHHASTNEDWEIVSTGGFAPMWAPDKAKEDVIFIPLSARVIPPKGKRKESAAVVCELVGGSSDSFYSREVKKGVANGDQFTIPLSYNLNGDDKLGVHEKKKAALSKLSNFLLSKRIPMRIVFDGKVKGGQGTVKLFTIQLPKGTREQFAGKHAN